MKKKNKILALLLIAVLTILLVAGCGDSGNTEDSEQAGGDGEKTIALVAMSLNSEFTQTLVAGAQQEADAKGIKLEVQGGEKFASADAQLTLVENAISQQVDGILIIPSSSEGLISALEKVKDAGIPLVNLDTRISADVLEQIGLTVPFYGTDNYIGAKAAGEYVKENFDEGTKTAILRGIVGQEPAIDRYEGFLDGAGSAVELVAEQVANWETDEGYQAAQNIITANPDLELIFACNDGMGIGALRAVQEAGLEDQIQIISYDGTGEAINLVDSGELLATVAQYPAEMGKLGVDKLISLINGEENDGEDVDTGSKLITKDQVAEFKKYLAQYE